MNKEKSWKVFERTISVLTFITLVIGLVIYCCEAKGRKQAKEDQRKAKHYQAWQTINLAHGKPGSRGRIVALQDLNEDGVSLDFTDISSADLRGINLPNAQLLSASLLASILYNADLQGADLRIANLRATHLAKTNLQGANLKIADLQGAILYNADLREADLKGANLQGAVLKDIVSWKEIKDIEFANISKIRNPPEGFIKWAKEQGAIEYKNKEEWEKSVKKFKNEEWKKRIEEHNKKVKLHTGTVEGGGLGFIMIDPNGSIFWEEITIASPTIN